MVLGRYRGEEPAIGRRVSAVLASLVCVALVVGCTDEPKDDRPRYKTEADCEGANPGRRCSVIMCDYKCPRNYAGDGWIVVGAASPSAAPSGSTATR